MPAGERTPRELPDLREVWVTVRRRARERPFVTAGAALAAGYLLGGGLFTRPSRWIARAALGALAVPSVRHQLLGTGRRQRAAAPAPV